MYKVKEALDTLGEVIRFFSQADVEHEGNIVPSEHTNKLMEEVDQVVTMLKRLKKEGIE